LACFDEGLIFELENEMPLEYPNS